MQSRQPITDVPEPGIFTPIYLSTGLTLCRLAGLTLFALNATLSLIGLFLLVAAHGMIEISRFGFERLSASKHLSGTVATVALSTSDGLRTVVELESKFSNTSPKSPISSISQERSTSS